MLLEVGDLHVVCISIIHYYSHRKITRADGTWAEFDFEQALDGLDGRAGSGPVREAHGSNTVTFGAIYSSSVNFRITFHFHLSSIIYLSEQEPYPRDFELPNLIPRLSRADYK